MNRTLRHLSAVVVVLFVVLMGSTTAIAFFQRDDLNTNPRNVRSIFNEFNNARGPIVAGGVTLAESVPVDSPFGFQRVFSGGDATQAAVWAPVTGYFSISRGSSGLERAYNQYLNGRAPALWVDRVHNMLTGEANQGSSVHLTTDPALQQLAWDLLDGQRGSVIAIDPQTGAILAMVTYPSYDPNALAVLATSSANEAYEAVLNETPSPLLNRGIREHFPPGSTFKMITAAAALESGVTAHESLPSPHRYTLPGTRQQMRNFGDRACSPTGFMSMHDAMVISCNTTFAALANRVGGDALRDMAERFTFNEQLRIPMNSVRSFFPGPDAENFGPDRVALAGIGQGDIASTPLTMLMMAATIANDGVMMQPFLVDTIRDPQFEVVYTATPQVHREVISPAIANDLTQMMESCVRVAGVGATCWRGRIPGVSVAGKTGTAQTAPGVAPHVWYVSFAPVEDPSIAVVVMIENGGHAGLDATAATYAVPIARDLIAAHLGVVIE